MVRMPPSSSGWVVRAAGGIVQRSQCTTNVVHIVAIDLVYYFSDTDAFRRSIPMPGKPTEQEDEYFARLEFERQRKVLDERDARAADLQLTRMGRSSASMRTNAGTLGNSPGLARAPSKPSAAPAGSDGRRDAIPADNRMATA